MHWFFILIFYGIAAFYQFLNNSFLYFRFPNKELLMYTMLIIFIWTLSYYVGSKTVNTTVNTTGKYGKANFFFQKINYNSNFIVLATVISVVLSLYIIFVDGFESIFSRATAHAAFVQSSLAGTQLVNYSVRNFVLYQLAVSILIYKKQRKFLILLLIQFCCNFIVNTPFGMPRFQVATVYLGLLLTIFSKLKKNKIFIFIFLVSMIVIFPVINLFRGNSLLSTLPNISINIDKIRNDYLTGNYDAFIMIFYAINYVKNYGITYGRQLLGVIGFFIPRVIWHSKPIGSGAHVLVAYGHSFTNGSMPLIAEGYINFGIIGVIIFGFITGKLVKTIDRFYWGFIRNNSNYDTFLTIFYPFSMFLFYFMNRGDLLSTFAYFVSHLAVYTAVFTINKLFREFPLKKTQSFY